MQAGTPARSTAEAIVENVQKVIVGKNLALRLGLIGLMCRGHVLIEDVPGVGKTMLAKSLARSTGCSFSRIQFTPDLLPSDIMGISIFNQKTGDFEFRKGPLHAQVVLADEINRATPKTQSALLEAMEEHQVTVDGVTHPLPTPFMVVATENPVEYEGTFPLPEAQLDRFTLRIRLGYPSFDQEISILESQQTAHPFEALRAVAAPEQVTRLQDDTRTIYVDPLVKQYIVGLADATRTHNDISLGASPRASLSLQRASQALALLNGRDYVLPDDVKELAGPVLAHRLILTASARMSGVDGYRIVQRVIEETPVPGARAAGRL